MTEIERLAAWAASEQAHIDRLNRWARVLHQRGRRLRAAATRAWTRNSHAVARDFDGESVACHGTANALAQQALIRSGHLERVMDAHRNRLASINLPEVA